MPSNTNINPTAVAISANKSDTLWHAQKNRVTPVFLFYQNRLSSGRDFYLILIALTIKIIPLNLFTELTAV
jgi:hypothetical protein